MATNNSSHSLPQISLILIFTTVITLTLLFHFQSQSPQLAFPFFSTTNTTIETDTLIAQLRNSVTFLPLTDLRFRDSPMSGHTWFMSSIDDTQPPDQPEHIFFPSNSSKDRILCLSAHDHTSGTKNSYAFAYPNALPHNSTLLPGLTVVSDTHYDYTNLWHGLSVVVPFVAWHESNKCVRPQRWVLFHWGELRTLMGNWLKTLTEATIGDEVRIEDFERYEDGPVCFERAVVFRHNDGGLSKERREEVYDMIRCKTRDYCNVTVKYSSDMKKIRVTLLLRVGGRAFKNETAVIGVFGNECRKVNGCVMKVARPNNLTFCDQVCEFLDILSLNFSSLLESIELKASFRRMKVDLENFHCSYCEF